MNQDHQNIIDPNLQYQNMLNMNIPFTTLQNQFQNQINKDNNQDQLSKNESEEGKKGKRRSKNETQGRTFICKLCEKSYLSYPALYTHCKQKHNTSNTSGRGRGRPKKDNGDNQERLKYNPLDASYFLKENRTGSTQIEDFDKSIKDAFNILYGSNESRERNLKKEMKNYDNIESHPFLGEFLKNSHDTLIKIDNEKEISDKVFMDYLNKMSMHVNNNYFTKLIIFVTLFREFVNISNRKKKKDDLLYKNEKNVFDLNDDTEYTSENCAEDVPDLSNDFINDFLETDKSLFDFNKEDSIDLTQNFCHWMYENNFTSSKLSLISNDNK